MEFKYIILKRIKKYINVVIISYYYIIFCQLSKDHNSSHTKINIKFMRIFFQVSFVIFFLNSFSQEQNIDSFLLKEIKKTLLDKQFSPVNPSMILNSRLPNDSIRINFLEKLIKLPEIKNNEIFLAHLNFTFAYYYYSTSNDQKKIFKYLNKAKTTYLKYPKYYWTLCRVYSYIATKHSVNGNFSEAIKFYNLIINQPYKKDLEYFVNLAKTNILDIFINEKRFDVAEAYINEIFEYHITKTLDGLNHKNLAYPYLFKSYYFSTYMEKLTTVNKGVMLMRKRQDRNLVKALEFRAKLNYDFKKFKLAKKDLIESLKLSNKINFLEGNLRGYTLMSKLHLRLNNPSLALKYLDSIPIINNILYQKISDSIRFEIYLEQKKYKKASYFAKKYVKRLDSIIKTSKDSLVLEYGKKYQTERKIQENKILKKENKIKTLFVAQEKNKRYFFTALSFIGLALLLFIYYRYKNKKRTANILKNKNDIISSQNTALEKANNAKQKLFSILAHDLINPFNAMLGYTQLLYNEFDNFNKKDKKEFIQIINNSASHNYKLVKSLLDWSRTQQNRITVKKQIINYEEIVKEACKPYLAFAKQKHITINSNFYGETVCYADTNMLNTCIGNIINNAIKFTPEYGMVSIETSINKNMACLYIKDTGIGISKKNQENLFQLDKINSRKGTNNEKGTGFGLLITKEFIELQNGTLTIENNKQNGIMVTLALPKWSVGCIQ